MSETVSELIKKELGLEKGSGTPHLVKTGNLAIEQIIKIAKERDGIMLTNNFKATIKTVIGTCGPLGVLVEGKGPKEACEAVDNGDYDTQINEGKTEISDSKKQRLVKKLAKINAVLAKEKEELEEEKEEEKPVEEPKEGEEKAEGEKKEEGKEEITKEEIKKEDKK